MNSFRAPVNPSNDAIQRVNCGILKLGDRIAEQLRGDIIAEQLTRTESLSQDTRRRRLTPTRRPANAERSLSMSSRVPKAATRIAAVALACLSLVSNVASFTHLVLVQHVSCEHGELVDLGHRAAPPATRLTLGRRGAAIDSTSTSELHGHDHCLLAPTQRERLACHLAPASFALDLRPRPIRCRREVARVAPAIPILAFAPKSSPPRG
jgi:hypothetical protein